MSLMVAERDAHERRAPVVPLSPAARSASDATPAEPDDEWSLHGWPAGRLGEAVAALARMLGATDAVIEGPASPDELAGAEGVERFLARQAALAGVDIRPVTAAPADLGSMLGRIAPAIIRIERRGQPATFLAVAASRRGRLTLLCPDLARRSMPVDRLAEAMLAPLDAIPNRQLDAVLDFAGVTGPECRRLRAGLGRDRLGEERIGGIWLFDLPHSAPLGRQLARAGIVRLGLSMLGTMAVLHGLEIMAWTMIGSAALNGRFDRGWLLAWMLVMVTLVPLRLLQGWQGGNLNLALSRLIKARLMQGSLNLGLDDVRRHGTGHYLGQVMESSAFETLAIQGGLAAMSACVELVLAGALMLAGAGGGIMFATMLGWLVLTLALGFRAGRALSEWTGQRLGLTGRMVERMIGHRTILAQEPATRRNADLDQAMDAYLQSSRQLDRKTVPFLAGIPMGWTAIGTLSMVPAFLAGADPATMAAGVGAMLLAGRGFHGLSASLSAASRAVTAWQQIAHLFQAGGERVESPARPEAMERSDAAVVMEARSLSFGHADRAEPVLSRADLSIGRRDRVLLLGASGSGKSTLASLLTGLRKPRSGLLLVDGFDRPTLGRSWHDRVTMAPQFQENHILSGPLAFNLLLGRHWPPRPDDLMQAEQIARRLGLGDLIERMPGGLMQMVGETGWQLSHGEKSRIFLARSLLQEADLTILDESFAALDPESLSLCLECACDTAGALMVIAHP